LRTFAKASWAILNRVIWISAGRGPVRRDWKSKVHVQVLPALVDVVLEHHDQPPTVETDWAEVDHLPPEPGDGLSDHLLQHAQRLELLGSFT